MSQSGLHFALIKYLIELLGWLFRGQAVGVVNDINFYQTAQPKESPKRPDIAVVDGLVIELVGDDEDEVASYYVGEDGPPPRVVIEIASRSTWEADLVEKPGLYAAMGVSEYLVFDPHLTPIWRGEWYAKGRLVGWRLDMSKGEYVELVKDANGRLWSEQLNSWLAVEGKLLRLYTTEGQMRLTESEAERARADRLAKMLLQDGYKPEDLL